MDPVDGDELQRRIRAAREWGGYRSVKSLAEAIGQAGLGRSVLYAYEQGRGKRPPKRDLHAIAQACGLPEQWFYIDVAELLSRIPLEEPVVGPIPRYRRRPGEDQQRDDEAPPSAGTDRAP